MSGLFELESVYVSYGKEEIVHGVSLQVRPGEFAALLGLNGSGKTTILHAACGLLPMRGQCRINGEDCTRMNEKARARYISFIPQNSTLPDGRTVLEVVLMGFNAKLRLLESPSREQEDAAMEALRQLGMDGFAARDFGRLSYGQKQLIILARCMVQDAPAMLMDEPDSALDFVNRHMVLEKIRELIHRERKAGLITLHDPNFAMAYCDRLILLKQGRICGEVDMRDADAETVRKTLSTIYGDICILPYQRGLLMGRA